MKTQVFILFLFIIGLFTSCEKSEPAHAKEHDPSNTTISTRSVDICFTSYNIAAFCQTGKNTVDAEGGANAYGQSICDVIDAMGSDVVNLQEVWCQEVADAIRNCLDPDNDNDPMIIHDIESGLMTISHFEIKNTSVTRFESESGFDATKNKGFLSTTLVIDDPDSENGTCELELINTHLQADGTFGDDIASVILSNPQISLYASLAGLIEKDSHPNIFSTNENIRIDQLKQIQEYMEEQDPCVPILIGGDLNIDKSSPEFGNMINLLSGQPAHLVTNGPTSTSGSTLDYYILNNFDSNSNRFKDMTTTIFDGCAEYEEKKTYRVTSQWIIDEDWDELDERTDLFNTLNEAQNFANDFNDDDVKSYEITEVIIKICIKRVENISDHHPIQTCFDEYDCDADC